MESYRRFPRITCDLSAGIVYVDPEEPPQHVRVLQLGQGGALIRPERPLEYNRVFILRLPLPTGVARLISTVRYAHDDRAAGKCYGLEFSEAEFAPRALVAYIDQCLATGNAQGPRGSDEPSTETVLETES